MYTNFKEKCIQAEYNKTAIPASKKNLNINATETQFNKAEFERMKKPVSAENKHKAVLRKIVEEKAKNEHNKDLKIGDDPDIIEADKKAKVKSCWCCGSSNCLIQQQICKRQGIKRQYF